MACYTGEVAEMLAIRRRGRSLMLWYCFVFRYWLQMHAVCHWNVSLGSLQFLFFLVALISEPQSCIRLDGKKGQYGLMVK